MPIARVRTKSRITLPAEVRKSLGIEPGDDLIFEVTRHQTAQLRVIKRIRLSTLYGSLPSNRPFPGTRKVRNEVGRALAVSLAKSKPAGC